jgi:hypothetical protein
MVSETLQIKQSYRDRTVNQTSLKRNKLAHNTDFILLLFLLFISQTNYVNRTYCIQVPFETMFIKIAP